MTMPERLTSAVERPMAPRATQGFSRDPDPSAWGLAGCPPAPPTASARAELVPAGLIATPVPTPAHLFCRFALSPSRHDGRPLHKPLHADSAARAARAGLPAIQAGGSKQHEYMLLTDPESGNLKPGVGCAPLGTREEGPSCLFQLLGPQGSLVLGPRLLSPSSQGLSSPLSLLRTIVLGFRTPHK